MMVAVRVASLSLTVKVKSRVMAPPMPSVADRVSQPCASVSFTLAVQPERAVNLMEAVVFSVSSGKLR